MRSEVLLNTRLKKYTDTQILEKNLADRKMIKDHLSKGGTLEQLKEKGFKFATLQHIPFLKKHLGGKSNTLIFAAELKYWVMV